MTNNRLVNQMCLRGYPMSMEEVAKLLVGDEVNIEDKGSEGQKEKKEKEHMNKRLS